MPTNGCGNNKNTKIKRWQNDEKIKLSKFVNEAENRAVFPKDRSADHLWSENILNLIGKEIFFQQKYVKFDALKGPPDHFMVRRSNL